MTTHRRSFAHHAKTRETLPTQTPGFDPSEQIRKVDRASRFTTRTSPGNATWDAATLVCRLSPYDKHTGRRHGER